MNIYNINPYKLKPKNKKSKKKKQNPSASVITKDETLIQKWFHSSPDEAILKDIYQRRLPSGTSLEQDTAEDSKKETKESRALREKKKKLKDLQLIEQVYKISMKVQKVLEDEYFSGESTFDDKILERGTTNDKLAALALYVTDTPFITIRYLDQLIEMCSIKNGRASDLAITTLKDLFLNTLLPTNKELKSIKDRDVEAMFKLFKTVGINFRNISLYTFNSNTSHGNNQDEADQKLVAKILLHWLYEDQIKKRFEKFLACLEVNSKDTIEARRSKVLHDFRDIAFKVVEKRYEVIQHLVNMFSDSEKKIASTVSAKLLTLINPFESETHKNPFFNASIDRSKVVTQISTYCLNTQKKLKSKYYAVLCLSQIELILGYDEALAKSLIGTYTNLCSQLFKTKENDTNMMTAVMAGMHHAVPIANVRDTFFGEELEKIIKVARTSHFNTSIEAMRLLFAVISKSQNAKLESRYFTMLYSKLIDFEAWESSKVSVFLALIYKSIMYDQKDERKVAMVKRLLQVSSVTQASVACAIVLLVRNVMSVNQKLKSLLSQPELSFNQYKLHKDEDEEVFEDKDKEEEENGVKKEDKKDLKGKDDVSFEKFLQENLYNPNTVRPGESHAEGSCLWELNNISEHFHPTVKRFVGYILSNRKFTDFSGDPISDFSLVAFLDKFMFKNPKKNIELVEDEEDAPNEDNINKEDIFNDDKEEEEEEEDEEGAEEDSTKREKKKNKKTKDSKSKTIVRTQKLISSDKFVDSSVNNIAPDEVFYYDYVQNKKSLEKEAEKAKKNKKESLKKRREMKESREKSFIENLKQSVDSNYANQEIIDDLSDASSVYSYADLDDAIAMNDMNDEAVEQLLMEEFSGSDEEDFPVSEGEDEDDDENKFRRKPKEDFSLKVRDGDEFGFDVTDGVLEDASRPNKNEISTLMEEGEEFLFRNAKEGKKGKKNEFVDEGEYGYGSDVDTFDIEAKEKSKGKKPHMKKRNRQNDIKSNRKPKKPRHRN